MVMKTLSKLTENVTTEKFKMRITKEQLKRIIKEELNLVLSEYDRPDLGSLPQGEEEMDQALNPSMPSDELTGEKIKAEMKAEIDAIIANKEKETGNPLSEPEWDQNRGSWVLHFETGDNTHWYRKPPPGWEVEERTIGAYDGDEQYIMYKIR